MSRRRTSPAARLRNGVFAVRDSAVTRAGACWALPIGVLKQKAYPVGV
jgi:hypothetical protein